MYHSCEQFNTVAQRKDCKMIKIQFAAPLTRIHDHDLRNTFLNHDPSVLADGCQYETDREMCRYYEQS